MCRNALFGLVFALGAGLANLADAGQSRAVPPGAVHCLDCALTGQRPAAPVYDESQVQIVSNWIPLIPLVFNGQDLETRLIARVLAVSPIVLEILDSRDDRLVNSKVQLAPKEPIKASVDGSNPAICRRSKTRNFMRRPRRVMFYFGASSVRKSVCTLVRQLRGPHLSTWA